MFDDFDGYIWLQSITPTKIQPESMFKAPRRRGQLLSQCLVELAKVDREKIRTISMVKSPVSPTGMELA